MHRLYNLAHIIFDGFQMHWLNYYINIAFFTIINKKVNSFCCFCVHNSIGATLSVTESFSLHVS